MAADQVSPARGPTKSRTNRVLTILRAVTLACAAVMACVPDYRIDAAVLAWIVLARP